MPAAHDTTTANAALWAHYIEQQWGRWLRPFGASTPVAELADGAAARIAGWLTLFAAGPIGWLYAASIAPPALDPARAEDDAAA